MRVFVLTTGRSGSTTFAHACGHITNFTSGHETRATRHYGSARFAYPDGHIEVDNRLAWFPSALDGLDNDDTLWVHLRRDPGAVARSFLARWDYSRRGGIIEAFAHSIIMNHRDWPDEDKLAMCRFMVDTVNGNIEYFLRGRPNVMTVALETIEDDFTAFWHRIGAEGRLEDALEEWQTKHAATPRDN